MQSLGDQAFDVTSSVLRCDTMASLSNLFASRLLDIGLTASACGMVTGPKAISADPFHFTNWPADWLKLYLEQGFVRKDPLPRWALVSGLPATWTTLIKTLPRGDPGWDVYRQAQARGFTEGMAVPVRSRSGSLGLVTCGGKRDNLSPQEESFIQTVATAVFHKAEDLSASDADPASVPTFSRREQEALNLLHHGFTDNEIGQVLGISMETVRTHLTNARLKVGARSRTHLVGLTSGSASPHD